MCRFLLSLYIMDSLGWICYKIVQFEAVRQAHAAGLLSPVLFVTLLTTLETTIEIFTSLLVPRVYALVEGRRSMHPGALAVFVMKTYTVSISGALVLVALLSPCLLGGAVDASGSAFDSCEASSCSCRVGGSIDECSQWVWVAENGSQPACCLHAGAEVDLCAVAGGSTVCPLTPTALSILLVSAYCVLYCFLNQLGDAGREMAVTTWLSVFERTHLVFPACVPSRFALRRPASARACSTFLQILRYFVQGVAGVLYVSVRSRASMRVGMPMLFAAFGSLMGVCVLCGGGALRTPPHAPAGHGKSVVASMPTIVRRHWPKTTDAGGATSGDKAGAACAACAAGGGHHGGDHSPSGGKIVPRTDDWARTAAGLAEEADQLVLWPWQLARWEVSLTCFLVCARGLPQQAGDTVLAYISSSSTVAITIAQAIDGGTAGAFALAESLFAAVGGAVWLLTLAVLVRKAASLPTASGASSKHSPSSAPSPPLPQPPSPQPPSWLRDAGAASPKASKAPRASTSLSIFREWVYILWALLVVMGASGVLLALPSWLQPLSLGATAEAALALAALVLYMPYLPIAKLLDVRIDAFLMEHSRKRAPSIVYWSNVLLVLVVWPLLVLKWIIVSTSTGEEAEGGTTGVTASSTLECGAASRADAQRESSELGLVVVLTGALLLIALGYFSAVDPCLAPSSSVHAALTEHARRCQTAGSAKAANGAERHSDSPNASIRLPPDNFGAI